MNYVDPIKYRKNIQALKEGLEEETIPVKGPKTMKERLAELSPDDQEKLKEYIASLKEIKKCVYELLNKKAVEEDGGNMSSGLTLK